jgi:glycosyltransferase involved in cell wall biosynthesis
MPEHTVTNRPRILLLSAYDAGSHRRWREQLVASHPEFDWHILALPPRFFQWRIRGNALTWLQAPLLQESWDLLLVTSTVDLATLRGIHPHLAATPAILYMHENQFAYPDSGNQHSSAEPKMVNLYSAVAANTVLFNSDWNRRSFVEQAQAFLDKLPDGVPEGLLRGIVDKSCVLPVPVEDSLFAEERRCINRQCPHLLWNHRWEYDKGPDRLLLMLDALAARGRRFQISVVGEQFRKAPEAFRLIEQRHSERLVDFGFMASRQDYNRLLKQADVVVSTALHDFQGLAMLEAMASGCLALAPDRLAYPEYVPGNQLYPSYPDDPETEALGAADRLIELFENPPLPSFPDEWRVSSLAARYGDIIRATLEKHGVS